MKLPMEKVVIFFLWICVLLVCFSIFVLISFLFVKGLPVFSLKLIFGDASPLKALLLKERVFDGLFPAIVGSFLVVILSVFCAIPVGIASGIYLAEFSPLRLKKFLGLFLDILASVPSIVIGLFGLTVAIFLHQHISERIYPCLLISSISLAILVLPYIVRATQLSLEAISLSNRLAGISLGASHFENLIYVLLPQSFSGILSGIILALGRTAEDTAVIMLTGVVATAGIPISLLDKYEALPFYIYYISSQYTDQNELMRGFAAAIILLLTCLILFIFAHLFKNFLYKRAQL